MEDPDRHPIAAALNAKPEYLASTTITEPRRANTTVLSGDLAAGPDIALGLVDPRAGSKGVTIQVYRPTGRKQYAPATAD